MQKVLIFSILQKTSKQLIWKDLTGSDAGNLSQPAWEVVPKPNGENQLPTTVIWELIETNDGTKFPMHEKTKNREIDPPSNIEEVEWLIKSLPLRADDYTPLLNLSHPVPTASIISLEEWNLYSTIISPFKYASGTGNQNYAIRFDSS